MKRKMQNLIWWAALLLAICVFAYSAPQVYQYLKEADSSKQINDMLIEQAVSVQQTQMEPGREPLLGWGVTKSSDSVEASAENGGEIAESEEQHVDDLPTWIQVDFNVLQAQCEDIVAWVYCPGTPINYPVVQTNDNSYYLRRMINGEENKAGTLFLDCRNTWDFTDQNSVIHGHHMKNRSMFGSLDEYDNQAYYEEHPVWQLLTPKAVYFVDVLAGYVANENAGVYRFGISGEEKEALVEECRRLSDFQSRATVGPEDRLVTFSTCSYDYDGARYVVIGVLRERS